MAVTGVKDYISAYSAESSGSTKRTGGLSDRAQDYLNDLRQRYSDVNIAVKDFGSDRQLKGYMLGITGHNNIAISASVIEKMASDPEVAAKYEKVIADVPKSAEEARKGCEAQGVELVAHSVIVDKNGKVSYCGVGRKTSENPGTAYKEKLQKQLEEKRAKKKKEEALKEKRMERAETLEKLLEKMKAGNREDEGKAKEAGKGTRLDVNI